MTRTLPLALLLLCSAAMAAPTKTVPSTLFNTALPPERYDALCKAAIATASDTKLSESAIEARFRRDGIRPQILFEAPGRQIFLVTPEMVVYRACYSEAKRMQVIGSPLSAMKPPKIGAAGINVLGKAVKNHPETQLHVAFLDAAGVQITRFEVQGWDRWDPNWNLVNGEVESWSGETSFPVTDVYGAPDQYKEAFAQAVTLRLEVVDGDRTQVVDLKVVRR